MKKIIKRSGRFLTAMTGILFTMVIMNSCKKDKDNNTPSIDQNFSQVNLVASTGSFAGARVDSNFVNGWGIAFSPTGTAWISAEARGVSVVYNSTGAQVLSPVSIPSPGALSGGAPSGQVFNATTDFVITGGNPAKFIFAGTDGVISGWNSGSAAVKMVDRSGTSSYTGLAMASSGGNNYLYAADFTSGQINVFDKNFALVSMSFRDSTLPADYSPFNIQNIGGQLYVIYAEINESTHDEVKGAGFGYVDVFNPDGSFAKRFASQGTLNAPWGITQAPDGFINNQTNVILIGNFGDGMINAYDSSGNLLGSLKSNGATVVIDGLWGISFAPATATTINPKWLFFAAGPGDESQGLFGYIQ